MARIDILKKISKALTPDSTDVDFSVFDEQIADLKKKLKEKVQAKTLDDVNSQLDKFRKRIDLTPFIESLNKLQEDLSKKEEELNASLESKSAELQTLLSNSNTTNDTQITKLSAEIEIIKGDIKELQKPQEDKITPIIEGMQNLEKRLNKTLTNEKESILKEVSNNKDANKTSITKAIKDLTELIDTLRMDMFSRLSRIGGGNANRQIRIGGVDYLTRYNDINLIAGTAISLTVANDDTNKRVNITFAASGSGVTFETPVGDIDDSNTTFTVSNTPAYINVNGSQYTEGLGIYTSYLAGTITLSAPVGVGGFIISAY